MVRARITLEPPHSQAAHYVRRASCHLADAALDSRVQRAVEGGKNPRAIPESSRWVALSPVNVLGETR